MLVQLCTLLFLVLVVLFVGGMAIYHTHLAVSNQTTYEGMRGDALEYLAVRPPRSMPPPLSPLGTVAPHEPSATGPPTRACKAMTHSSILQ